MRGQRVAVVGGGITGLLAAWHLRSRGAEVFLLERELRVGGLIDTEARGGFRFEHGPQGLASRRWLEQELERLRLAHEVAVEGRRSAPALEDRWIVPGVVLERSRPQLKLRRGMASLVDRVAGTLGSTLRLGATVRRVVRQGRGFRIDAGRLGDLVVDRVVLACPAFAAAPLLAELDVDLAAELASLAYARVDVVSFGFAVRAERLAAHFDDWPLPTKRWSVEEGLGATPPGGAVLRCITQAPGLADAELVDHLRRELREVWGIDAPPRQVRLRRHARALPVYPADHPAWAERVRARAEDLEGIAVIGSAYDGVGVPECVASARRVAA